MARIEVEQQVVVDDQLLRCLETTCAETQHRVTAVAVVVDEDFARRDRARSPVGGKCQAREGVCRDVACARAKLTPGNRAVAIGVELEREVEIAQRDVPLPGDERIAVVYGKLQVT